jgi:hypothetical protein
LEHPRWLSVGVQYHDRRRQHPNRRSHLIHGYHQPKRSPLSHTPASISPPTALTPDVTLTLNYVGLIAPIVKAIQARSSELATIESTIAGFAESFTSALGNFGRVNTQQLCVGSTCVTPQQFQAMVAAANQSASSPASPPPSSSNSTTTADTPPVIQINGDNPAHIHVGDSYQDLGAIIIDPQADLNLGIKTFLNGALVSNIVPDTTQAATDTIDYVVTDQNCLTSTTTRTIIVSAPQAANDNQASTTPANDNTPSVAATSSAATSSIQ